jgi:hypothetical protein
VKVVDDLIAVASINDAAERSIDAGERYSECIRVTCVVLIQVLIVAVE